MRQFTYKFPGKTVFGAGMLTELADFLPPGGVLIVHGAHAEQLVRENIVPQLGQRNIMLCGAVQPEPTLAEVERAKAAGRADVVIAVGGGSAMDTAKVAAMLMTNEGSASDYFYKKRQFAARGAFFAAIPTTAGTGSEATPNAVLTDEAAGIKQSIRHDWMFPDLALVDPVLTYGSPQHVAAGSGFDALTQAVESFCSRGASAGSRALAAEAVGLLLSNLDQGCNFDNHEARDRIAEGSLLGALAFSQSSLGAVHGLAHPIGSLLRVPHGVCCSVLLPEILQANHSAKPALLNHLAAILHFPDGNILIDAVVRLRKTLLLPENFSGWKLDESHFDFILRNCRSGSMKSNCRDFSDEELAAILERLR